MNDNGQITYLPLHRYLTNLKYQDLDAKKNRDAFMTNLLQDWTS
jgi:hypothetical protein